MSTTPGYYPLQEEDVKKFLNSGCHCGEKSLNSNMREFVFSRKTQGHYLIDLKKTWMHLQLAARVIAGIENPKDVLVVSSFPQSHRAVLKFSSFTGASVIAGNYTPGTLTNQAQQKTFKEPRLVIVSDPVTDHQVLMETASVGVPVIALCNTNCPLNYVDIVIPCNNRGVLSIGVMWWLLTREVLRFKGMLERNKPWEIMVDVFFHVSATQDETEKEKVEKEKSSRMDEIVMSKNRTFTDTSQLSAQISEPRPIMSAANGDSETWDA